MEGNIEADNYNTNVAVKTGSFFLKGNGHSDWGVQNRLARIFNPKSGNTVMARVRPRLYNGADKPVSNAWI